MLESQQEQNEMYLHKLRMSNNNLGKSRHTKNVPIVSLYANTVCI